MATSSAAIAHVAEVGESQEVAVRAGRRTWRRVNRNRITDSWIEQLQLLVPAIAAEQRRAATAGASYVAGTLAEQGTWVAPAAFADTDHLGGWAPDGRTLQGLLYSPAVNALTLIGGGMSTPLALEKAGQGLDQIMTSLMADTSRQAAAIDVGTRDGVGWVRMVNPPCCSRCAILAGRFYRWNEGFLRHPKCDCVHVPSTAKSLTGAKAEGLIQDPYDYFKSLSRAEQDRIFTASGAQAIRDGADMGRVVNARRGMTENGMFTSEGMGRRGFARQQLGPRQRRLTPEGIYKLHPNRADALAELERHGYLLPGGQDPLGAIKGANYEGFGELGRGGTRRAATQEVLRAREAGIRAGSRYTMTAAERRLYDAQQQWRAVLAGRNPWGRGPLTPRIAAAVEDNYKRQLTNAGQVFSRADDAIAQAERITVRAAGEGSGAGGRPPRTGLPGAGDEDARAARQAALGIETHGEVLTTAEIQFVERFQSLGHQLEWIARSGRRLPTNDFRWLDLNAIEVELKSTLPKYTAIRAHITRARNRASAQGVTKENFLIDLGDQQLTAELRRRLQGYNRDRSRSPIRRMWVMSQGRLEEIQLT